MPVVLNTDKMPQENVWHIDQDYFNNDATGSSLYYLGYLSESFFKSTVSGDFSKDSKIKSRTYHNGTNKNYIKLSNLIKSQYEEYSEYYDGISLDQIENLALNVISELLSYTPDALSLELTNEQSVFYTFKKEKFSFYLQQYFETEEDGFNSTLITFEDNKKLDSVNGNIEQLLIEMKEKFNHFIPQNLNLAMINELSY